jgi:hypothetical protein
MMLLRVLLPMVERKVSSDCMAVKTMRPTQLAQLGTVRITLILLVWSKTK